MVSPVTTVPDIPVVRLPAVESDRFAGMGPDGVPAALWAVDVPRGRRPSPPTLAVLGVLAGIGAMALGAAAVISAGAATGTSPSDDVTPTIAPQKLTAVPGVERRALALLAKPSTERIPFRGSRGLVLAVGSGGRAAILVRGLERAAPGRPYGAWIVAPGRAPVRAAKFVGTERAVLLAVPVRPKASVVVTTARPVAGQPALNRVVALRG